MIVDQIENGIVLDHIKAGYSMLIYNYLGLNDLDCTVAIIKNVKSSKMGKKDIIKIDHHDDSPDFGNLCYVDPKAPACCQIITQFASDTNLIITKEAAKALYTGMVTDTGRFQFRGLSRKTFDKSSIVIK